MTFSEILPELMAGKKVQSKDFYAEEYIQVPKAKKMIRDDLDMSHVHFYTVDDDNVFEDEDHGIWEPCLYMLSKETEWEVIS